MADGRSALKQSQLDILEILYAYRFMSRQLLAASLGIQAGSSLYERLQVLLKHGYVGVRFEMRLKLQGVPAAYFLTPKGFRTLRALPDHAYITDSVIKASYKDKTVGQTYISHILSVYTQYFLLKSLHPSLKLFTQRDMSRYDYFPNSLPDAFLSLSTGDSQRPKRFFFDVVSDSQPRYVIERRIANYCQFFEDGGWDITGSELPTLLLVCEWGPAEQRLRRSIANIFQRTDFDELQVLTTTMHALRQATGLDIWTSIEDPDELVSL